MNKKHLSDSVAIQLLQLLRRQEIKEFSKWLRSPWCNSNKRLVPLYDFVKKFYPDFSSSVLTRKRVFGVVYPSKAFNEKMYRNLLSELSTQIRQFLVLSGVREERRDFQRRLIQEYGLRGKSRWFTRDSHALLAQIDINKPWSWQDTLDIFLLNEQLYFSPDTTYRQQKEDFLLQSATEALDEFYLLGSLKMLNEQAERQHKFSRPGEGSIEEKASSLLGMAYATQRSENPIIDIYCHRLENRHLSPRDRFDAFEPVFRSQVDSLPSKDQRVLYLYLLNDAVRLSQSGNTEVLHKTLQLYKLGIDRRYLFYNKTITASTFLNLVSLASVLKDFDFLDRFLPIGLAMLPEYARGDAENWAEAKVGLEKNSFEKCIENLKDYKFENFVFTQRARLLLLQAYFEQFLVDDSYFPLLKSYCRRVENNMRNEKRLSEFRKLAFIRFIQFLRKIASWRESVNRPIEKLHRLKDALAKEDNIQGKYWLEQQMMRLERGQ